MDKDEPDYILKIVLLGDSYVGKTNVVTRYFNDHFSQESKATVGVDFYTKFLAYNDKKVKAQIWDTAGQERYKAITQTYFKGAKGGIIIYDITRRNSFNSVNDWYKELKQSNTEEMSILLIGNKCDLNDQRQVSQEEAENLAKTLGIGFLETSAKENINIEQAFVSVVHSITDRLIVSVPHNDFDIEDINNNDINERKGIDLNHKTASVPKKSWC